MKNQTFAILVITLLLVSPSFAMLRYDQVLQHYNNLNESVKAVLGSVLDRIDRINFSDSDSSDGTNSDDADQVYDLAGLFAEPEEQIKKIPAKIEDFFDEAFGKDNKFFEGLMEMVASSLEKLHDHDTKFIDVTSNLTKNAEALKEEVLGSFKNFHGLITNILDNILDDSVKIDDEEYIVSDKKVNKPVINDSKEGENETKESSGKEEIDVEGKQKLKNGLKTASFIKNRLGKKIFGAGSDQSHQGHAHTHGRGGDKTLRRQNALKPEDFEKYFNQDKEDLHLRNIGA